MEKDNFKKTINKIKEIGGKKLDGSITIRIDNNTKERFEEICSEMGLSISAAISSFVNKVVNVGGIPFSINATKGERKIGILDGKYEFDEEEFNKLDDYIADIFEV